MKRLIICCDGPWHQAPKKCPTTIGRIIELINSQTANGISQIIFNPDVICNNTPGNASALITDIDNTIQNCYRFIVNNYVSGDELWFFGFSQGAYIARSCIGFIRNTGLLYKRASSHIPQAYRLYRTRWNADASNVIDFRKQHARPLTIKFLGAWDTVGNGGIPVELTATKTSGTCRFHDNKLSSIVANAYHALAIDEQRKAYGADLWTTNSERTYTEQSWFSGNHGDLGGLYSEAGLAHISLKWMISKATGLGLEVDNQQLQTLLAKSSAEVVHKNYNKGIHKQQNQRRAICTTNNDETLHSSAEHRFLLDANYSPANLKHYLAKDEQIQLPI